MQYLTMSEPYQPKRLRYYRHLPHWQAPDGTYAVTFRLDGSLPKDVVIRLKEERDFAKKELLSKGLSEEDTQIELSKMRQFYFGKFDDLLENNHTGPSFLKEPAAAQIVADAILHFDEKRYQVINFTIMSNHVHLTFCQLTKEIGEILGSIKKYTARRINALHNRPNRQVWLYDSYDHLVRNQYELAFYHTYTLENSVKANIVSRWEDYPFTYARPDFEAFYQPQLLRFE
ncbi:MAG: transposase [Bacteroidota bacterium]